LWAHLRDGERSYSMLRNLLSKSLCYPNLFAAHPPLDEDSLPVFQIDGNLGGTAGITEMLVQSDMNQVVLLPALPKVWQSGSLGRIRLRGNWAVSLNWSEGVLERAEFTAFCSGSRTVQYGKASVTLHLQAGQAVTIRAIRDRGYSGGQEPHILLAT
jgi:alpha-L-fucosidase 2